MNVVFPVAVILLIRRGLPGEQPRIDVVAPQTDSVPVHGNSVVSAQLPLFIPADPLPGIDLRTSRHLVVGKIDQDPPALPVHLIDGYRGDCGPFPLRHLPQIGNDIADRPFLVIKVHLLHLSQLTVPIHQCTALEVLYASVHDIVPLEDCHAR
jgi:hypothetical protein